MITTIVFAAFFVKKEDSNLVSFLRTKTFQTKKLTETGATASSVISPDGKFVVYQQTVNGKTSLWRQQLDSSSNVQILPPTDEIYSIIVISNSGEDIYFTRKSKDRKDDLSIYLVSNFGGVPTKLISGTQGWFSLSPDDKTISFLRCYYKEDKTCSLYIADSDGKNERKLLKTEHPFEITGNQFSTDGKKIMFATGHSISGSKEFGISEFDLESGKVTEIIKNRFFRIYDFKVLPKDEGFCVAARLEANEESKIWLVDKNREIYPLTADSANYLQVSLNKDATRFNAIQNQSDFRLFITPFDNPEQQTEIALARDGLHFTNDGKIVYASSTSTKSDIWQSDESGGNQRQLTYEGRNFAPYISPDENYIFFTSNRSATDQIWRMNMDGSNQIQITKKGGVPLGMSPDKKFLYFKASFILNLWQVPIDGGEETLLWDKTNEPPAFSPDGTQVAMFEQNEGKIVLRVYSIATKQIVKEFSLEDQTAKLRDLVWARGGDFLAYTYKIDTKTILWTQNLSDEKPTKFADLGEDYTVHLAISSDDKKIAFTRGKWKQDSVLLSGIR